MVFLIHGLILTFKGVNMEFVLIDLHFSCRVIFLTPNQTFPAPRHHYCFWGPTGMWFPLLCNNIVLFHLYALQLPSSFASVFLGQSYCYLAIVRCGHFLYMNELHLFIVIFRTRLFKLSVPKYFVTGSCLSLQLLNIRWKHFCHFGIRYRYIAKPIG